MYPPKLITLYYSKWCMSVSIVSSNIVVKYVTKTNCFVSMGEGKQFAKNVEDVKYVSMGDKKQLAKNAVVVKYASITE